MTPPEHAVSAVQIAQALGQPPPTAEQIEVIQALSARALVVAGAGSGKTETMAARVVWLVTNGLVRADQVLGLTFTRKAAVELADRVTSRLRTAADAGLWLPQSELAAWDGPTVSTYHAYAGRLVAEHGLRLGVEPDSRLLSEAASWQLAHEVVESYSGGLAGFEPSVPWLVQAVLQVSSSLAEHLVDPWAAQEVVEQVSAHLRSVPGRAGAKPLSVVLELAAKLKDQALVYPIVQAYLEQKAERGVLDFADQMAMGARLAINHPAVGTAERARFRAVLLDEFQDASQAQLLLMGALFGAGGEAGCREAGELPEVAVTAVGDPHQSIYGWRGASAATLARFGRAFGEDTPVAPLPLSTSWRNSKAVLAVANRTAEPLRHTSPVAVRPLTPRPAASAGSVQAARLSTQVEEADHIAQWVRERWLTGDGEPTGRTAAVLCRTRAQFDEVTRALRSQDLPVEVVGLGGLLHAPEVSDVVALLTVAQDPTRGAALMRLLTGSVCRLGAADLDALWDWAGALQPPPVTPAASGTPTLRPVLSDVLHRLPPSGWVSARGARLGEPGRSRVARLGSIVNRVRRLASIPLPDLVGEAERLLGLDIEVAADPSVHPAWGRAQLDALQEVAASFMTTADRVSLGAFVDWIDVARTQERGLEPAETTVAQHAVQVLTVHAAKGLEWDLVAVPGLVEAMFPSHTGKPSEQDGSWTMAEPTDRGWAGALGAIPYPVRGDHDRLPVWRWDRDDTHAIARSLKEFRQAGGRHLIEEERRLAYVAFTRARDDLLLTAPVWTTGVKPRVTSRFLMELVAAGLADVTEWESPPDPGQPSTNPLLAQQLSIPWPPPSDDRRQEARDLARVVLEQVTSSPREQPSLAHPPSQLASPDAPPQDAAYDTFAHAVALVLAEATAPHGADGRATPGPPGHLAVSSLVSLAEDAPAFRRALRRPVPRPPSADAEAGTAFHAWVEQHYTAAGLLDIGEDWGGELATVTDDVITRWRQTFLASPWADRAPLQVELPVETVIGGVSVRGRIDAVFPRSADAGRQGERAGVVLVDWKTGHPPTGSAARARAVQLAAYRLAYLRLTGLAQHEVDAVFYYADTGQTLAPRLPDEAELERIVGQLRPDGVSGAR